MPGIKRVRTFQHSQGGGEVGALISEKMTDLKQRTDIGVAQLIIGEFFFVSRVAPEFLRCSVGLRPVLVVNKLIKPLD
jgi:hypothetical protein